MAGCQRDQLISSAQQEWIGGHYETTCTFPDHGLKRGFKIFDRSSELDRNPQPKCLGSKLYVLSLKRSISVVWIEEKRDQSSLRGDRPRIFRGFF